MAPTEGTTTDPGIVQDDIAQKTAAAMDEKFHNRSGLGEEPQSKKAALHNQEDSQSKDFFWDQAVKLCASGMLALTLLDLLSSIRGEAVQCLTPNNYTRDQGGFINAYCTQFTHRTKFFFFLLVAQAILVYGPHFLWSSVYFGKFRYFSALALSLDRHRDSKTGEFDSKNFVTVRALMDTFGTTHIIYIMYIAKLIVQLAVAVVFIGICAGLFNEYDPVFDCPDNKSLHLINGSWPLDEQTVCVLSSLNLLLPVWWANFVLLTVTVVVSICGLLWCGLNHQTKLNWRQVARFALQSGIQPSYYHPKSWKDRWFSKCYFMEYRICSNLDFLFLRLYRDDAGRAQVLREVLIAQVIAEEEQRLQERLSFLRRVKDEDMCTALLNEVDEVRIRKVRCSCKQEHQRAKANNDLGNTLESVLCNFLTNPIMNLEYINAVDISFGSSGFKMLIATMDDCDQVVSVNFDPHYLNKDHTFMTSSFLSEIYSFRTWSTMFAKEKEEINKLRDEIAKRFFDIQQLIDHDVRVLLERNEAPKNERANVVLVGPIPKKESQHKITVHWLLNMLIDHKLIDEKCYLVTVRPRQVENESVDLEFAEYEPAWVLASRAGAEMGEESRDTMAVESNNVAPSESETDRGTEGRTTVYAEISSAALFAPRQVRSSANNTDGSSRTREIAYLRHGEQAGQVELINYYSISHYGELQVSARSSDCDTHPMPNLLQRRNVLVECGSTQCEFEIKVYDIKAYTYASRGT